MENLDLKVFLDCNNSQKFSNSLLYETSFFHCTLAEIKFPFNVKVKVTSDFKFGKIGFTSFPQI